MKQNIGALKRSVRLTSLWQDRQRKKEKTQIIDIGDETEDTMTDSTPQASEG